MILQVLAFLVLSMYVSSDRCSPWCGIYTSHSDCHTVYNAYEDCICYCEPGYGGSCCDKDIDYCGNNLCRHGHCVEELTTYSCSCLPGYTGRHCETDINECASNPCMNSATCHDKVNEYKCTCAPGYSGLQCQTNNNECVSNPCGNNGRCIDHVNGYTCACTVGHTGTHCEFNLECHSQPCLNGGICTDDQSSGHTCHCSIGYTGVNCEIEPPFKLAPKITVPREQNVNVGAALVTVPCFAIGIPAPSVTWDAVNAKLPSNAKQIAQYLVLTNVTVQDRGFYTCTAKNSVGTDIQVIHLIVVGGEKQHTAPIISAVSIVQVKYYMDARLFCNVTGYPQPGITWEHNNKIISSNGDTLTIHRVTQNETGTYTCIATNDAGTSRANIELKTVYDSPRITLPPSAAVIIAGQSHNFSCRATGYPIPNIIWNFTPLSQHTSQLPKHTLFEDGEVIELENLQESGELTCTAENEFGTYNTSAFVIVKNPGGVFG